MVGKGRSDVGWRLYDAGKSEYYPAIERRSVRSLVGCSQLSLFGGGMGEDCERLQPQPKRKLDFHGQEREGNKASNGVVCHNLQESLHEM